MTYCSFCKNLPSDNLHKQYHDERYGFPIHDDNELFGRLILEINQAGLSWDTILKKEKNFRLAYDDFQIDIISSYDQFKLEKLLNDKGIVRNRLKINAAINNAEVVLKIQQEFGSFKNSSVIISFSRTARDSLSLHHSIISNLKFSEPYFLKFHSLS
jgi:DNA-3-methyladenine glycosylase I